MALKYVISCEDMIKKITRKFLWLPLLGCRIRVVKKKKKMVQGVAPRYMSVLENLSHDKEIKKHIWTHCVATRVVDLSN